MSLATPSADSARRVRICPRFISTVRGGPCAREKTFRMTAYRPVVLLVDDEPGTVDLVGQFAERAGFDVVPCSGGRQVLGELRTRRADLVMVDGNPLAQISNTRRVVGTMVAGRWYDSTAIEGIKSAVVARLKP